MMVAGHDWRDESMQEHPTSAQGSGRADIRGSLRSKSPNKWCSGIVPGIALPLLHHFHGSLWPRVQLVVGANTIEARHSVNSLNPSDHLERGIEKDMDIGWGTYRTWRLLWVNPLAWEEDKELGTAFEHLGWVIDAHVPSLDG